MSEDNYKEDIADFVKSLGDYLGATPNENQSILTHVLKQIQQGAILKDVKNLEGKRGYEPIIILEAKGKKIAKRIFHPLDIKGADFAISKELKPGSLGITAVQVKRNHKQSSFTFREDDKTKELTQLRKFREWQSGYYLMIDETTNPPLDCFVRTSELVSIIESISGKNVLHNNNLKRVNVPNYIVHQYCRGSRVFYEAFYACRRGATIKIDNFLTAADSYVLETNRSLVELFVQKVKAE